MAFRESIVEEVKWLEGMGGVDGDGKGVVVGVRKDILGEGGDEGVGVELRGGSVGVKGCRRRDRGGGKGASVRLSVPRASSKQSRVQAALAC